MKGNARKLYYVDEKENETVEIIEDYLQRDSSLQWPLYVTYMKVG